MQNSQTNDAFVDLDNARLDDQRQVMQQIVQNEECPFCLDNLKKYHKQPILKETSHWLLTHNQWPYENTKLHLMAIYKDHAETLREVSPAAGQELLELFQWAEAEYHIPGGGMSMRFGDTNYSAGTIKHIHAMLIWPDWEKADFQPVRIKLGKTKD